MVTSSLAASDDATCAGWSIVDRNVLGTGRRLDSGIDVNANPGVRLRGVADRLASPRSARLVGAVTLLLLVADLPLVALAREFTFSNVVLGAFLGLPFALVGVVVANREPRNPVGWLLLTSGFLGVLCSDAGMYSVLRYRLGDTRLPLGPLAAFLAPNWIPLIVLLPLPIALFPDGRLPSRWWRATLWVYLGLVVAWLGVFAVWQADGLFFRPIRVDTTGEAVVLSHPPANGAWHLLNGVTKALLLPYIAIGLAWVGRQLVAYRHATGEPRQQLKWLIGGGAVVIGGFMLSIFLSGQKATLWQVVSDAGTLAFAALPISIGIGILKYRLYEIDRLISRTISYLIITGLLVGVFISIVVLATDVLPFSSPVAVAASTLAAAALFNPLRLRVQRLVDRRFNRARYDAEAIVAAFNMRLRDAVDLDTIRGELLLAVDRAVEPAHASVWIRPSVRRARV
jgi:hypothetical protein